MYSRYAYTRALTHAPTHAHTYTYARHTHFATPSVYGASIIALSTNRYCLVAYRLYLIDYSWIPSVSLCQHSHTQDGKKTVQKKKAVDSRMPHHRHQASVLLSVVVCQ